MERKTLWKNFLLLTVSGLLALHINVTNAAETTETDESSEATDACVLVE